MSDKTKLTFVSHFIPASEPDYWRWSCKHCPADSHIGDAGKFPTAHMALEAGEAHDCTHEWDEPELQLWKHWRCHTDWWTCDAMGHDGGNECPACGKVGGLIEEVRKP